MAIIVEDGSIVPGANSYVSEADLTAYAAARGITLIGVPEQLLIKAMDYLESLYYKGRKLTRDQSLEWPRYNVIIDGYYLDSRIIPQQLKNAEMQLAMSIDVGDDPLATQYQSVSSEKVDVIEVSYAPGSSAAPIIRSVNSALSKLLAGGGGNVLTVYRG